MAKKSDPGKLVEKCSNDTRYNNSKKNALKKVDNSGIDWRGQ